MGKYFDKLPIISYNGVMTRDITRSVKVPETLGADPHTFYPYVLQQKQRADSIASAYYDDPYAVWLVYLSNGITDPYFDWHLSEESFAEHINAKYGSLQLASRKIEFYRVNWYDDPTHISRDTYAELPESVKKYWEPIFAGEGFILYYGRKQVDWTVATNRIYAFEYSDTNNLEAGDLVQIMVNSTIGHGEVVYSDSSTLYVKNVVIGTDLIGQAGSIISDLSASPQTLDFTSVSILSASIPDQELIYWSPVTSYDVETERNAENANIRLLDKALSTQADQALTQLFAGA